MSTTLTRSTDIKTCRLWAPFVLSAAGLALACSGGNDAADTSSTVQRDSAGVTIVENADPSLGNRAGWRVGESPQVDIGTVDGEEHYQLFRAGQAIQLNDGRVAVANRGSSEVRVFDQNGTHLDSWGGDGEGPGEYRSPLRLAQWPGDSVGVWDSGLRRLTVLTPAGALGRTVDLKSEDQTGFLDWVDVFPNGEFIVTHQDVFGSGPQNGVRRLPVSAAVMTGTGEELASLGEQPGDESFMRIGDGNVQVFRYPFAAGYVARRAGEEVIFGPDDLFELRFHSPTGGLERIVRLAVPQRAITDSDIDAEHERALASVAESSRAAVRASQEEMTYPEAFPAFSEVLVDPLGNVWVQQFRPPVEEGPGVWAVFDPEGAFLGWVDTPAGLTVYQIGTDFILGHWTDGLEVEHIQLWELIRG